MLNAETVLRFATPLLTEDRAEQFVANILASSSSRSAVIWLREQQEGLWVESDGIRPEYVPDWISIPSGNQKVGSLQEHQAGHFYCADLSSVILGGAVAQVCRKADSVVDVCASPGGKSILMHRYFAPLSLVCNEVVSKRVRTLIGNLSRCRVAPAEVYSNDVRTLANSTGGVADVVVADVPCSAQSLGHKADYPFSNATIKGNATRQKRIISSAGSIVKPGGYLAYITCTFSPKENEEVISWFLKRNPQFKPMVIPSYSALQSHITELPCYRIWPFDGLGKGGFVCILQNQAETLAVAGAMGDRQAEMIWKNEQV